MAKEGNVPGSAAGSEGWGWFDQAEKKVEAARNEDGYTRADLCKFYETTYRTKAGAAVYQDLARFRRVDLFDPALGFYNGAAQGFYLSGMAALINHIEQMIIMSKRGAR